MTTSQDSFYESIEGALTPQQAVQALALAEQGDTGTQPDNGGVPSPTTALEVKPVQEAQLTADNAVILAKDGKHTIPFDQLDKARQQRDAHKAEADSYRAQAEEAQRKLTELQAQAQSREENGQAPTITDNMAAHAQAAIDAGIDASLFGDFSEESLAAGIQKLVTQQVAAQMKAQMAKELAPLQAKQQQDEATTHYSAIYGAHPNADSIAQSNEFKAWVDAHPSAVRNAYWQLFDPEKGGTASEIIEVFDAFKAGAEKQSTTTTTPASNPKAAASAAVRGAQAAAPSSLSSIPGGRADGLSPNESMAELSGPELYAALEGKTPAQIEAFLNQQM